jgi:hypothetical protein
MTNKTGEIKLTGWGAVGALVAIAAFGMFKLGMQNQSLQEEGVERIQQWLVAESARSTLPEMEAAMQAGNADALEELADGLREDEYMILSVTRHGSGDELVARVEYQRMGDSSSRQHRYFRMTHSMVTGWRVERETSRLSYYLAAF